MSSISDWLQRGQLLEREQRWGEALTHYEDGLRQFPGEGSLKQRFSFARLHYELCRRYNDHSFRDAVGQMSLAEALDVYDEVLLKIQAHYVDAPNWKVLVESGADALNVALGEKLFLEASGQRPDEDSLAAFRTELRQQSLSQAVQSRDDVRQTAAKVATMAAQRLGVSPVAAVMEFVCGAMSTLDQYSTFLTPGQLNEVFSQIEGNFVGLGVELKGVSGTLVIMRVIPGSPAKRAGVRDGDRILAVDGRSTEELSTDAAANLLQGEEGTTARLVLAAPGEQPREVHVHRERVEVPSVDEIKMLDAVRGLAYLKITSFQKTTFRELDTALWSLHRSGMKKLIIDLRGNPGGLLVSAVDTADLFLNRGVIVSTRGRNTYEDFTYSAREPGTWRVPLVVLVDQDSASAAEIFAGAIRDLNRGTVVGCRSYGKGSVQGIFPLSRSTAGVRLTTAKFYSPTGHAYAGVGVEPHVQVHQVAKPVDGQVSAVADRDPMLSAAVRAALQTGYSIAQPVAQR